MKQRQREANGTAVVNGIGMVGSFLGRLLK